MANNRQAPAETTTKRQVKPAEAIEPSMTNIDVGTACREILDECQQLARSVAAYTALDRALRTETGQLDGAERPSGMPIFEFPATLDGRDSIKCCVDVRKVPRNYVQHVLVPLMHVPAGEILEALDRITQLVDAIKPPLQQLLHLAPSS